MKKQQLLTHIHNQYSRLVSSVAHRMIANEETARDAAQQVWYEIVKSIDSFQEKSKLSTWIYTLAYRTILKYSQQERRYSFQFLEEYFQGEPLMNDTEDSAWIKGQCDNCLTGILHCLDNETRLIYILRDIAGLSYDDLAEISGKTSPALRKLISRTRKKLKNFLNKQCALFNPEASQKCRMHCHVKRINLNQEYKRLAKVLKMTAFFKTSNRVLPGMDYWIGLLK